MTASRADGPDAFVAWLEAEGANRDLVSWARGSGLGFEAAYDACPRGDWVLALAIRAGADARVIEATAVRLAALARDEFDDPELDRLLERLSKHFDEHSDATAVAIEAENRASGASDLAHAIAFRIVGIAASSLGSIESAAMLPSMLGELAIASVLDCAMSSAFAEAQRRAANAVRELVPASSLHPRLNA